MTVHTATVDWRSEWRGWALLIALMAGLFYLPVGMPRFDSAVHGALVLVKSYAREHVLLCLVPALYIAGAIATFLSDHAVMRYLGAGAAKVKAYAVAALGGTLLAVCSCTVLPLFAGISRRGAGLGPATAFLYSGPAINVLAISLTAGVLGWELGLARAVGAVLFAVVIGLAMAWIFRRQEAAGGGLTLPDPEPAERPLWQNATLLGLLVAVLVTANWSAGDGGGPAAAVASVKWPLTALAGAALAVLLVVWMDLAAWKVALGALLTAAAALAPVLVPAWAWTPALPFTVASLALAVVLAGSRGEGAAWFESTWGFTRQIVPLLFAGVFVAGLFLGAPGSEGLVPEGWVARAVGGEGLVPNLFAAVAGALMYFATLTEVPIVQGLLAHGMGQGPALTLLLAGPAVSLPNLLVISRVLGWRKTGVYVVLVVVLSTVAGWTYGAWAG